MLGSNLSILSTTSAEMSLLSKRQHAIQGKNFSTTSQYYHGSNLLESISNHSNNSTVKDNTKVPSLNSSISSITLPQINNSQPLSPLPLSNSQFTGSNLFVPNELTIVNFKTPSKDGVVQEESDAYRCK